jgi:hypothetical protein
MNDAETNMDNALKANPKVVAEQYYGLMSEIKYGYDEGMLEERLLKAPQSKLLPAEDRQLGSLKR